MTQLSSPAKGPGPPSIPHLNPGEALAGDLEIVETGLAGWATNQLPSGILYQSPGTSER